MYVVAWTCDISPRYLHAAHHILQLLEAIKAEQFEAALIYCKKGEGNMAVAIIDSQHCRSHRMQSCATSQTTPWLANI